MLVPEICRLTRPRSLVKSSVMSSVGTGVKVPPAPGRFHRFGLPETSSSCNVSSPSFSNLTSMLSMIVLSWSKLKSVFASSSWNVPERKVAGFIGMPVSSPSRSVVATPVNSPGL